jgi:hypothetical protein
MSVSCDGRADVFQEYRRKARKRHVCDACNGAIRPGDLYNLEDVLYEGRWSHTVRCARCQLIFEHLVVMCREHGDSEEWPDPELDCGHEYRERWEVDPPAWLAALAFWVPGDPLPHVQPCDSRAAHCKQGCLWCRCTLTLNKFPWRTPSACTEAS